jgi:hypothetical protein
MRRFPAFPRAALRFVAIAVLVFGLVSLGPAAGGDARRQWPEAPAYVPNPERIALQIDGWKIEVDGVDAEDGNAASSAPAAWRPARQPVAVVRGARLAPPLSRYDQLIHWHAASQGLDWRLVSALIQEESGFQPGAVSSAGAIGLMQVRPIAAEDVGESNFSAPDDNIRTGVRYLKRLESLFGQANEGRDRLGLVLAAYNVGPAHVQDAQTLARAYGFDPRRWDNSMARILPLLDDPTFYQQLPAGRAAGRSVVTYVERILNRYERYKAEAGNVPGLAGSTQAASASG